MAKDKKITTEPEENLEVPGLESDSEEDNETMDDSMQTNVGSSSEEYEEPYYVQEGRRQFLRKKLILQEKYKIHLEALEKEE